MASKFVPPAFSTTKADRSIFLGLFAATSPNLAHLHSASGTSVARVVAYKLCLVRTLCNVSKPFSCARARGFVNHPAFLNHSISPVDQPYNGYGISHLHRS